MSRQNTHATVLKVIDLLTVVIARLGPWALAVLAAYFVRGSIESATHQPTLPQAWMRMMSGLPQVRAFAFIFGMLGLAYGIRERELRRTCTERLMQRTAELERQLNEKGGIHSHQESRP
jgi:hypothetical protein